MLKNLEIQITAGTPETNRDYGKVFHVTEMPALQAERWGQRALFAIIRGGFEIPGEVFAAGAAALMAVGIQGFYHADFSDAEPLLAEMLACVRIKETVTRSLTVNDIEEVSTILLLREEVIRLHMGFLQAGAN